MALLHRAELRPTKLELLAGWLPAQPWYAGGAGAGIERVAAYRFDDPADDVGIETILVRVGAGPLHQVPLTYRAAPLDGGDAWHVGTCEHSVLGRRWIYDGCGDPVYQAALAGALAGDVVQADEYFEVDGRLVARERNMTVSRVAGTSEDGPDAPDTGAGLEAELEAALQVDADEGLTRIDARSFELTVLRRPALRPAPTGDALVGTWSGQSSALVLAYARPR